MIRTHQQRQITASEIQEQINDVTRWYQDQEAVRNKTNKQTIKKTKALRRSLDNKSVKDKIADINNENLHTESSQNLKYLGNHLDRTLALSKHVEETMHKTRQGVSALKNISYLQLLQETLFTFMKTVVLPNIDYGLSLLTLSNTYIPTFYLLQNEVIRFLLGYTKTAPTAAMRYIMCLTVFGTNKKCVHIKEYHKIRTNKTHSRNEYVNSTTWNRLKRGKS